jgi:probable rRNA maturation factor
MLFVLANLYCGKSVVIFRKSVPGLSEAALERFLVRAGRAAGLRGVVNVLVTTNRELQALNSRFRGEDKPTDVLSFAPLPGLSSGLAGDIAISGEIAAQNARQLGHASALEIKILALHGILHLAGHDHESDQGEMARKEASLRTSLGLPSGLIERNGLTAVPVRGRKQRSAAKAHATSSAAKR